MTKMTMLHFASPFAFSMPVLSPAVVPTSAASTADKPDGATDVTALDGADPLTVAPQDGTAAAESVDGAVESAGFEASLMDTILRRYRDQQGDTAAAATEEGDPDPPE